MIIQIEKLVPDEYVEQSRDFQLLGRLFDCVANMAKINADTIPFMLNTTLINDTYLELLKTKVGLIQDLDLTDDELRYVLQAFPYLIRRKGSMSAIKEMLNMCLKIFNINATFRIERSTGNTVINNITLDEHSFAIGIDTVLKSDALIRILAKYLMPPGFFLYIYYYMDTGLSEDYAYEEDVELLYVSNNINSRVQRLADINSYMGDVVGGVDVMELDSTDSDVSTMFKGIFTKKASLPTSAETGAIAIVHNADITDTSNGSYYFYSSSWHKINLVGLVNKLPSSNVTAYDVVALSNKYTHCYYAYLNNKWTMLRTRGSVEPQEVLAPQTYDFVNPSSYATAEDTTDYVLFVDNSGNYLIDKADSVALIGEGVIPAYYFNGSKWIGLGNYQEVRGLLPTTATDRDYVYVDGVVYYIYIDGKWQECTAPMYLLEKSKV